MTDHIVITRPDDWHVHLRDGEMLGNVVGYTARQFARAIVMPNLASPITDIAGANAYRERILRALPEGTDFTPLMTCYLTDQADAAAIAAGYESGVFAACKLYPAHATTNSSKGVTDIRKLAPVLESMQRLGMPLLIHGEVTRGDVDIFDREAIFIETVLAPLMRDYPALKIVLEHITTAEAVDFVTGSTDRLAATITPHHLMINRNAMFEGGIRPHAYCLPVAKREHHRLALRKAAVSGSAKFFLGTDSAPHQILQKESACGCAGIFNAPYALEYYAQVFDEEGALDRLEGFASLHGPRFYNLPVNSGTVELERREVTVPQVIGHGNLAVSPFLSGSTIGWAMVERGTSTTG